MALRWRGQVSLLGRIYVLVGALFALTVIIAGATFAFRQRVDEATTHLISAIVPAETATTELITIYAEQANGVHGFLLTDDPAFLQAYTVAQTNAARFQAIVDRQLAGDPVVTDLLAQVSAAGHRWHQFVQPQLDRGDSPGPSVLSPAEAQTEGRLFNALRTKLVELRTRVDEIAAVETARADAARTAANWLTVAILLVGIVVAAGAILLMRKSLTRPLRRLVSQVNQVSEGDLDRSVHEVGPPELTTVARAVETMRARIISETRQIAQMQQELARHEEAERRRAEQDFATVVDALDEGVVVLDSAGIIESANPATERILGVREAEIVGSSFAAWRLFDESGAVLRPETRLTQWTGEPVNSRVVRLERTDGHSVVLSVTSRVLNPAVGPPYKVVTSFTDITERLAAQKRLEHEATHDPLTGLANRTLVLRHLEHSQQQAQSTAVLFLDLDNFKIINDSLGHGAGDEVLRIIGQRLVQATPDEGLVGRLGGDEFVVLTHNGRDHNNLSERSTHLLAALTEPIHVQDRQLHVNGSIGIVVSRPGDARNGQDLLRDADVAMYQAKTRGGGRYAYFDVELRERVQRHMALEQDLRHAVDQDQLWVAYQPVVDLRTERTVGVEGLLRWRHPVHGTVSPGEFIPLAEESDLINSIGAHMLGIATRRLAAERERHQLDLRLNANLSPRQLDDPDLRALVQHALAESGLPAHALCLEVTEDAIMHDPTAAAHVLNTLRELGVTLAIDDFGTGYSSLAQLRQLRLDTLKIDRSFVSDLSNSDELQIIVTSIVAMAHAVGLDVVAEGVETADQLDLLREIGCDQVQGYYLGKPAPLDELLTRHQLPDHDDLDHER